MPRSLDLAPGRRPGERTVHHTVPPSVEYRLTDLAQSLAAPVMALADWTFAHLPRIHANRAAYDGAMRQAA